jgi:hypothetical protein
MNVWVVTVGDKESFNSVWISHKLAWRHAKKLARDHAVRRTNYRERRFKQSPEQNRIEIQGHNLYGSNRRKIWDTLEVFYVEEQPVQGDAVDALAAISADD